MRRGRFSRSLDDDLRVFDLRVQSLHGRARIDVCITGPFDGQWPRRRSGLGTAGGPLATTNISETAEDNPHPKRHRRLSQEAKPRPSPRPALRPLLPGPTGRSPPWLRPAFRTGTGPIAPGASGTSGTRATASPGTRTGPGKCALNSSNEKRGLPIDLNLYWLSFAISFACPQGQQAPADVRRTVPSLQPRIRAIWGRGVSS